MHLIVVASLWSISKGSRTFIYTSVLLWVETIRKPRVEGCRPPGGANAGNDRTGLTLISTSICQQNGRKIKKIKPNTVVQTGAVPTKCMHILSYVLCLGLAV